MLLLECMEEFRCYVRSYCAAATVDYYVLNLHLLEKFLLQKYGTLEMDINALQKKDFIDYITYHRNRYVKNTSVRTYARAAKVFFKYCYTEGYLLEDITKNVKYPKPDNAIIIPLSAVRVDALENVLLMSGMPERNYCIFKLMLDCGLRLGEVVGLNIPDVDFNNNFLTIRNTKNCKSRLVPLPAVLQEWISDYLEITGRVPEASGPLFLEKDGMARITKNAISIMFGKLKKVDAGIYPHLLRHTFATSFILGGGSLEVLRILMGHEDYNVTKQYLHIAGQMQIMDYDIYHLDDVFFKTYNYRRLE